VRTTSAFLLAAFVLPACSDPAAQPEPPHIVALYGKPAETALTPYPSDRYTQADATTVTGRRVHIGTDVTNDQLITGYDVTVKQLNEMDGFSTVGGVVVNFSGPIDARSLVLAPDAEPPLLGPILDASDYQKPGAPFYLVNVDPASPERGQAMGLITQWYPQPADGYYPEDFTLVAEPAVPLRASTKYAFVVTNVLHAEDGRPIDRSADMEALLGAGAEGAYGEAVSAALGEIESSIGVKRSNVLLATTFTTATVRAGIEAAGIAARKAPTPMLVSPWEVQQGPETSGRVRFKTKYEAPEYRSAATGTWEFDNGTPKVQKMVDLELFLSFSKAEVSGKRPVVIFGHGLGGDKDGTWGTSDRLAAIDPNGVAVFGIDSPEHGSRARDPNQNELFAAFYFFGIDDKTQTFDIGKARDNFRQMSSDQLELVRLINSLGTLDLLPVGAPDGIADLDTSRILYIGHSFGSVQGPMIMALAPEIKHSVWNVGGDGLMRLIRDSGTFGLLVNSFVPPLTPEGALGRFFATAQAIVDPGDPINYAHYCALDELPGTTGSAPRDILLQVVLNDTIVPNSSSESLARAMGAGHMNPVRPVSGLPAKTGPLTGNGATGSTLVMSQFDKINGGENAVHGDLIFAPEGRAQYVDFFKSGLAAPHATAKPPY
jgi:pimeloyl-ACP methyl ester carboxylesterase